MDTTNNTEQEELKPEAGTYELIRRRLLRNGNSLREVVQKLNEDRKRVLGSQEAHLLATDRVTTENNCIPYDMIAIGDHFIFGYNVHIGLKTTMEIQDVFSVYCYKEHSFHAPETDLINDKVFQNDFKNLYAYYKDTTFVKFARRGTFLYMIFQIGRRLNDLKAFKWAINDNTLKYIDDRSIHEFKYPRQHDFNWKKTTRDNQRLGRFPHISVEDKVFVETIGGDLTFKVEDNTDTGSGIYAEKVEFADQTLDDAAIFYAVIDHLIVFKILPYQENNYRYYIFNSRLSQVIKLDGIEDACILLPDNHGVIFPDGYYLQKGDYKKFDHRLSRMIFETSVASPNGEDFLYIFYNQELGIYLLLPYNMISQSVAVPIICHGYMIFHTGEMCYFVGDDEPKKHHVVQIWQTPFSASDNQNIPGGDSYLAKIGNKSIVKALAECNELIYMVDKEETYTDLYYDILNKATNILDSYYWLGNGEVHNIKAELETLRATANTAIEAYEKVVSIREATRKSLTEVVHTAETLFRRIDIETPESIRDFISSLQQLRIVHGQTVSLQELRYINLEEVEKLIQRIIDYTARVSKHTTEFLLGADALDPFHHKVRELETAVETVDKTVEVNRLDESIRELSHELEMLSEVVSNLKIEDPTHTSAIIETISAVFSRINKLKADLRTRKQALLSIEGKAEFNSQLKLIGQAVINYLDMIDTPEKADEYLAKIMIQLEDLDSRFGDFDDFLEQVAGKREEIYEAFESLKFRLTEERNKKINGLFRSAERILKSAENRAMTFKSVDELNGYFASDALIAKLRDCSEQIIALGDTVKADGLQSRLKSVWEDAQRQLKDRKELFVEGSSVIRLGNHSFNCNTQRLEATIVRKDNDLLLHLTGTEFYEPITAIDLNDYSEVKDQELVSETNEVYRAEFLAYSIFEKALANELSLNGVDEIYSAEQLNELPELALTDFVQRYMSIRFNEGYVKGIHDLDASKLLKSLLSIHKSAGLLRYDSKVRTLGRLYWEVFISSDKKGLFSEKIQSIALIRKVFPQNVEYLDLIEELCADMQASVPVDICHTTENKNLSYEAACYLFEQLCESDIFPVDQSAHVLIQEFKEYLSQQNAHNQFFASLEAVKSDFKIRWQIVKKWISAFFNSRSSNPAECIYLDECTWLLINERTIAPGSVLPVSLQLELHMQGTHRLINEKKQYTGQFNLFLKKLEQYNRSIAPAFIQFQELKKKVVAEYEGSFRLNEYKAKVMTSFIRNQLINKVYLPLIGANLAKQIGAAGEAKRTDLMGMLLLISPPGYGKTTLMEYVANRLGLVFMKINGPALGHSTISLDPQDAGNAAAREELRRLGLAFEMGNNVMIYVDDIQHCSPEFLQKFISLCDAQRKIEGVYNGVSKTYDFRGKKVAVVMAGNPYTESGEKFVIPDMLTNRADIYNLGDIIGGNEAEFKASYIENAMTSNPVLAGLSIKSHSDIHKILAIIANNSQEGVEFEGNYSAAEIQDYVAVTRKMLIVRDILLKVNAQYIYSAAQADEYRTEPAFKLQGSYRNMNKIAERIVPLMNDEELEVIIMSHYENEAQTLTMGAEANILKFRELTGRLGKEDKLRWNEIKTGFIRQQKIKGFGSDNQLGQLLVQVEQVAASLEGIRHAIRPGIMN